MVSPLYSAVRLALAVSTSPLTVAWHRAGVPVEGLEFEGEQLALPSGDEPFNISTVPVGPTPLLEVSTATLSEKGVPAATELGGLTKDVVVGALVMVRLTVLEVLALKLLSPL